LLGVIPHQPILSSPTLDSIHEELRAEMLNDSPQMHNLVDEIVIGAMGVHQAMSFFKKGALFITPVDREEIILAAATSQLGRATGSLAGMILTGASRPGASVMKVIREMPFPVLYASDDIYPVASKVHDLIVKIRPDDLEKISLIRDLIAKHVDVNKIVNSL
jgi:BioD-like phosphotransacetylase family protein